METAIDALNQSKGRRRESIQLDLTLRMTR